MIRPKQRLPLESDLAEHYRRDQASRRLLTAFIKEPTIRTLFALGEEAQIRYYETAAEGREDVFDKVQQIYAVTYPDQQQQPKSFFIALLLQRSVDNSNGRAAWTLVHVDGGIRPPGW
jgi:hypothetical protein